MKRNTGKMLGAFLIFMLAFTFLSRAAGNAGMAKVTTAFPKKGKVNHKVTGTGKVVSKKEVAVSTLPGQVVESIEVEEGAQVKKGDVLFKIDLEVLKEDILNAKQEMEKEELLVSDRASAREAKEQNTAIRRNRAAEDYQVAAGKAETATQRAARELKEAKKKLKDLEKAEESMKDGGNMDTDPVEESLKDAIEQKELEYRSAMEYKEDLQNRIDEAVTRALAENQNGYQKAVLIGNERDVTMAENNDTEAEPDSDPEVELVMETDMETEDGGTVIWMDADVTIEPETTGNLETGSETDQTAETEELPEQTEDTEQILEPTPVETEAQTEDPYLLEQRIRQENQPLLEEADRLIREKESEVAQAKEALSSYQQQKAEGTAQSISERKEALQLEIRAKKEAYEDTLTAAGDSLRNAGRNVEDGYAPEGEDSTGKIDAITREQRELELSKLEKLLKENGEITSPVDGTITNIHLLTGEKTPDGTAILMDDKKAGYRLKVQIPTEQEAYIGTKDKVTVKSINGKKEWNDLEVAGLQYAKEEAESFEVTVSLPEDSFSSGESVTMESTRISETYDCCVPLSALYQDNTSYFVYVVTETESVLGTEQTVQRLDVSVLDKNETDAALTPGSVGNTQSVVVTSDKFLSSGDRVRVMEA